MSLPYGLVPMLSILTAGESGDAKLESLEITQKDAEFHNLCEYANNRTKTFLVPGSYMKLSVRDHLMMTDTPHEAHTNKGIIEAARGDVLIAGLGMGMILIPILRNPKVTKVSVVEVNLGVIELVHKPLLDKGPFTENEKMKLEVIQGDIFDFNPKPNQYDVIYFDIWPSISFLNLREGRRLKTKFRDCIRPGGWMRVWMEEELLKEEEKVKNFYRRHPEERC